MPKREALRGETGRQAKIGLEEALAWGVPQRMKSEGEPHGRVTRERENERDKSRMRARTSEWSNER